MNVITNNNNRQGTKIYEADILYSIYIFLQDDYFENKATTCTPQPLR